MAPSIVLYGNGPLTSPYVFSVFIALEEKQLPFELRLLALGRDEHKTPDYAERSVTSRVPALVHDGFWLSESSAITEYLEETFAPPAYARMYPADPKERGRVRMVQALVRSDFLPIREERSTDTVFQSAPIEPLSERALSAVQRLYRVAEQLVPSGDRTIASEFSIADIDLAMMLQRLLANRDPMPVPLAQYTARVWQRPSVQRWLQLVAASR
jgi:glutathione S-transferase